MSDFSVSVVIPAFNARRTLPAVLEGLASQRRKPREVIVVDDRSTDGSAAIAESLGARVIQSPERGYAGGARNLGWAEARGDTVVFLDSDAIPAPGWGEGLATAIEQFPGAIIGCARTFEPRSPWAWVAHLQFETPYLPAGKPREVASLSSYCLAVPRDAPVRWDESYGGEDALFSADALAHGMRLVFDPRFHALHDHRRNSFADLRSRQRRFAYGYARCGSVLDEGVHKRIFSRVPLHHFLLLRLVPIYRRLRRNAELRRHFVRMLPRMIIAEWTLGLSASRYVVRRPNLRGRDRAHV